MIHDTRQSGCIVMTSTWYILGLEQQIFYVATLSRPLCHDYNAINATTHAGCNVGCVCNDVVG